MELKNNHSTKDHWRAHITQGPCPKINDEVKRNDGMEMVWGLFVLLPWMSFSTSLVHFKSSSLDVSRLTSSQSPVSPEVFLPCQESIPSSPTMEGFGCLQGVHVTLAENDFLLHFLPRLECTWTKSCRWLLAERPWKPLLTENTT